MLDPTALHPTNYWHRLADGRVQCDVCPRDCKLHEGQRGLCFVRAARGRRDRAHHLRPLERASASTRSRRSRSTTSCPGTRVLSFGTAGCNLGCKFCQNWDISQVARDRHAGRRGARPRPSPPRPPRLGCASVAFTYNDPVIFLEYAIDVADACHERRRSRRSRSRPATSCPSRGREFYAAHGRGQRRPQGVHRGLLPQASAAAHLQPVLDTLALPQARDRRLVRDHHPADPRPQRLRRRRSTR